MLYDLYHIKEAEVSCNPSPDFETVRRDEDLLKERKMHVLKD